MPPRIQTGYDISNSFMSWFTSVAPISRTLAAATVVATVLGKQFKPLLYLMFLQWQPVVRKFQIWRLFTNFLFVPKPALGTIFHIVWIIQHGVPLEQSQIDPADYVFMLLFNAVLLLAASALYPMFFLSNGLIMSIIYVWSRTFPDASMNLYGVVNVKSFYLPFVYVGFSMLGGQSIVDEVLGIVVGHLYYFLKEIYPAQTGRHLLETPAWLKRAVANMGLRSNFVQPTQQGPAAAAPQGFQAFRGRGQRLGQ